MTPFAIAGIQMRVHSTLESNLEAMKYKLNTLMAIYPWVQLVLFSELAVYGPLAAKAQPLPGPAEAEFQKLAAKHHIWLIPGSIYERDGQRVYNTAPVINPHGEVVGRYRKMFPFYPYEEGVSAGNEFMVFDVPHVGRFGVSICYDMWFPETIRTLVSMGAEVILHPSMTPTVDRDVELSIARATAVQQQCYIFDINGVGDGGVGRSIVVGPEGAVIHQAGNGEEMIPIEVDLDRVRRSREFGMMRLGQVLKSFRDRPAEFPIYQNGARSEHFDSLGPLLKPTRYKKTFQPGNGKTDLPK
ncbi:MAG: carbon-nitrogen hydrolase family protein [Anaerolineaceae bacterium]|nr:carbon-nitrogen hydrolase family protein [Anaerolineaceae bacterium]MCB9098971.1 carbon-nitrogen hydrolase family protein [Anaerolineales bacterium]